MSSRYSVALPLTVPCPRAVRFRLYLLVIDLISPLDLIPDVIPGIGYVDDAIIVALAIRSVTRRAGPEAIQRQWPGTPEGLATLLSFARLTPTP